MSRRRSWRTRCMFRIPKRVYSACLRETYRCIDFVYNIPQTVFSLRNLDAFYEYCKYIYRRVHFVDYGKSHRVSIMKPKPSNYHAFLKDRSRYYRRREKRRKRAARHLFDVFSGTRWHDVVMTQLGLKPHKWYFSTIKKHRQYDWARNKFVRRQAKYHIEEKYHGQILEFESIIGRALESGKMQVYAFSKKVARRTNVYRLGLLSQALSNRLDSYLRKYFPQLPLSRIRQIISTGVILVNDLRITDVHYVLDSCDVVQFDFRALRTQGALCGDLLYNNYFITLFSSVFAIRNRLMRQLLKRNLFSVLHRTLRTYFRQRRSCGHHRANVTVRRTLSTKYWRIGRLDIPDVVWRRPHWEHPYSLRAQRRRQYVRYNVNFADFLAAIEGYRDARIMRMRRRRRYVLMYLRRVMKMPVAVSIDHKVRVRHLFRRRRYLHRSKHGRMRWGPVRQRSIQRRRRRGIYRVNRTKVPVRRVLFGTNIAQSVERNVHSLCRYLLRERTWHLPTRDHVARMARFLSNLESVVYIPCFVRFMHKKLSVYVNPICSERTLTLKRMLRLSHGIVSARDDNGGKHSERVTAIGQATIHTGHSFWDRLSDNLYASLQLVLPQLLADMLHINNYSLILRHDLDVQPEAILQRRRHGLYTLPLSSHTFANAQMFRRFVSNKAQIRRSFAHSPFVTSRHVLFGPNRDTYNSYL